MTEAMDQMSAEGSVDVDVIDPAILRPGRLDVKIKIERPEGDFARGYDATVNGESSYFVWINRGKESIALDLKLVQIHWYGLTYLVAFGLFLWLASLRVKLPHFRQQGWSRRDVEDLLFFGVLGVVLGGRIGYALFYKPGQYLANPLEILMVWKGGMSFHGGMLGVIIAMVLLVQYGDFSALFTGDAFHHPVQVAYPEWGIFADTDPAGSTASRRKIIDKICDTDTYILAAHFMDPTIARVVRYFTARDGTQLEDREEHRHDDAADHHAEEHDEHRLDQ